MNQRRIQQLAALAIFAVSAPVFAPGCVIRVGPAEEGDESAYTHGGTSGPMGNSSDPTPGQMLALLDPDQLAMAAATADTAGYITMSSFAGAVADSTLVDEATFNNLIATYAPLAFDEASLWISSLDPATLLPVAAIRGADLARKRLTSPSSLITAGAVIPVWSDPISPE